MIQQLSNYQHISFDLWLTLIRSNPQFKIERNRLFRDFFKIEKSIEEVSTVIRKYDVLTNYINERVGKNFDTLEIYFLILAALDVDLNAIEMKEFDEFYALTESLLLTHKPLLLDEKFPQKLEALHNQGKSMNILSNTAFIKGSSLRKILQHYDMEAYFSFQIYSDEAGFSKPNNRIYQLAYDEIVKIKAMEKKDIIHVGDNRISDFDGAKKFGFNAYLMV
ncbi:HAD family hydrolase [Flavobacterium kingsejongi]|uniref:Phosphoglycolate phosphatase n=1 Tax=Flavobacterium kingsejongi TaxID=1678728 RepID=A0A2S1LR25_9FLAO|nr:HAD family hydrolase [Flavobacterium kingsejongi]AWG26179.1 phosphoglycolate phosphatase [Flavobacterium kingsejongi]